MCSDAVRHAELRFLSILIPAPRIFVLRTAFVGEMTTYIICHLAGGAGGNARSGDNILFIRR